MAHSFLLALMHCVLRISLSSDCSGEVRFLQSEPPRELVSITAAEMMAPHVITFTEVTSWELSCLEIVQMFPRHFLDQ